MYDRWSMCCIDSLRWDGTPVPNTSDDMLPEMWQEIPKTSLLGDEAAGPAACQHESRARDLST